jgi:hypothetical protein
MTATELEPGTPQAASCYGKTRGHYYTKVNGVWVCVACKEPRP